MNNEDWRTLAGIFLIILSLVTLIFFTATSTAKPLCKQGHEEMVQHAKSQDREWICDDK